MHQGEEKITLESAMKGIKINPPAKGSNFNKSGAKDASPSDATSFVSSIDGRNSVKEKVVHQEALVGDHGMHHYEYYYPDYMFGEWDGHTYALAADSFEIHPSAHADNGMIQYHVPGLQAGYSPYNTPVIGVATGFDGQYLAHPSYYPSQISPQSLVSYGAFPQSFAYTPELIPLYNWNWGPSSFLQDGFPGSTLSANPIDLQFRSNYSSPRHNLSAKKLSTAKTASEIKGSPPASGLSHSPEVQKQTNKPLNKANAAVIPKAPLLSSDEKEKLLSSNKSSYLKENEECCNGGEKLESRNKLNAHEDFDLINEQNCDPRTNTCKVITEVATSEKNQNGPGLVAIVKDEFNLLDFPTKYEHAFFFVIKSYTEDDVHKSIKYNVWASTPNGNKRLDNAFQVAQEMMAEKGSKCPVFLFFSVNASGQFCGVAEMMGRVDFSKNMDFWQQDKWNGVFPVKWHMIKDIPNPHFRHIILENNENKPVTNSRDTQEVKFPQGFDMLSIFKNFSLKTSILDDFSFYEERQRTMQDKRSKQTPKMMHLMIKNSELIQGMKQDDTNLKTSEIQTVSLLTEKTSKELPSEIAAVE